MSGGVLVNWQPWRSEALRTRLSVSDGWNDTAGPSLVLSVVSRSIENQHCSSLLLSHDFSVFTVCNVPDELEHTLCARRWSNGSLEKSSFTSSSAIFDVYALPTSPVSYTRRHQTRACLLIHRMNSSAIAWSFSAILTRYSNDPRSLISNMCGVGVHIPLVFANVYS